MRAESCHRNIPPRHDRYAGEVSDSRISVSADSPTWQARQLSTKINVSGLGVDAGASAADCTTAPFF
jgi:hypothetical protein